MCQRLLSAQDQASGGNSDDCVVCIMLNQAHQYTNDCLTSHDSCKEHQTFLLPSRVLDLGRGDPFANISLSINSKDNPRTGQYVALSYCWGESRNTLTTVDNIEERKRDIELSSLPKTIRDAVYITRRLGIQYLWVDALCILQARYTGDAEAEADWEAQSATMDLIYGNSVFTLVAGSSNDCDKGIILPNLQWMAKIGKEPREQIAREEIVRQPVLLRAWTLQERLLSCRTLSMWSYDMVWRCRQASLSNVEGSSWERLMSYDVFNKVEHVKRWFQLIQDYSRRQAKRPEDKLNALAGIARKLELFSGDTYLAGLWKEDLFRCMLWRLEENGFFSRSPPSRPGFHRAPSWSWASVDGNIWFHWASGGKHELFVTLDDFDIKPASSLNPLGEIASGTLTITGPIKKIQLSGEVLADIEIMDLGKHIGNAILEPTEGYEVFGKVTSDLRYCLILRKTGDFYQVILLAPIEGAGEHYIRVGAGVSRGDWSDVVASAEKRTIVLH